MKVKVFIMLLDNDDHVCWDFTMILGTIEQQMQASFS